MCIGRREKDGKERLCTWHMLARMPAHQLEDDCSQCKRSLAVVKLVSRVTTTQLDAAAVMAALFLKAIIPCRVEVFVFGCRGIPLRV